MQYANRQVDRDNFNSYTTEIRWLQYYTLFNKESILSAGLQYFNNDLHRQQLGKGTTANDFDMTLVDPGWGRDLHFKTQNLALFLENKIQLSPRFSVSPGARIETGHSNMSGTITYYSQNDIPNRIDHQFPLFGLNAEFKLTEKKYFYGGWSQAYRPVIFKDIIPASLYEKVDKNLSDAYGYNFEIGFRGNSRNWRWDFGFFRLRYNNRMGNQALLDQNNVFYIYRTNIGNSITDGLESYFERTIQFGRKSGISLFTSTALFNGRYTSAQVRSGNDNLNIRGNKIESVPNVISRSGITYRFSTASISFLYSYTGQTFADALNTRTPSSNGSIGVVPAYGILDINSSFRLQQRIVVRVNVNNVLDKSYYTKRPAFYPGPGIWPSDGRSINVSVGIRI
jgi:Fe(3+) dicitrate transport protein